MTNLAPLKDELAAECRDDHVGLWAIISSVRDRFEEMSDSESREAIFEVIRDLISPGHIGAGQFIKRGDVLVFEFWSHSPADAVERIRSEWDALGRDPIPGEVTWLTSVENGGTLPDALPSRS